jgi:hypothetical protein
VTAAPADPAPPLTPDHRSPAAPLFCWLVIQLLALSLGALRVPLAARLPPPGEQYALHTLLVVQVIAAAALFPLLMRDAASSAMAILSIAPFVQLAAYLSSVPLARAALAGLYVAIWLATLALCRSMLRGRRAEMLGVACAAALSIGGAIIWYAHTESRDVAPIDWSRDGLFGAVLGAVAQLEATRVPLSPWFLAIALLSISAALAVLARRREVGASGDRAAAR